MPETGSDAGASSDSDSDSGTRPTQPLREGGPAPMLDAGTDAGPSANDAGDSAGDATTSPLPPFEGEGSPWKAAAPRATCASGDMGDPGTQGLGGDLRCNLVVAGKVAAPHFLSLAWYKDCAYVNGSDSTTVIDVSDSAKPTVTTTLSTAGMRSNWESMKVHQARGVLVGYESVGPIMDVYDVASDCKKPLLKTSFAVGGIGHSGNFSSDGTIYYASSLFTSELFAVDITQLDQPKIITSMFVNMAGMPIKTHDLSIEKDGSRGYFTFTSSQPGGSIAIVDLSQIQARAPGAKGTAIKEFSWPDGSTTQYTTLLNIRGKDHLLVSDELGSSNCDDPAFPVFGYARILDISDETNPKLVSQIKTEALEPAHCTEALPLAGLIGFGVGTHYCSVDRTTNPRLLGCGFWAGGMRVFDIRNPWRPKEVAYFDTGNGSVPGLPHFRADRKEVWIASGDADATFYVLKFPEGSPGHQILSAD
jgi:hypothetical protein